MVQCMSGIFLNLDVLFATTDKGGGIKYIVPYYICMCLRMMLLNRYDLIQTTETTCNNAHIINHYNTWGCIVCPSLVPFILRSKSILLFTPYRFKLPNPFHPLLI